MPAFDVEMARAWSRRLVAWWVPSVGLIAGWVAAFAISVAADTSHCSAADPSICGPDLGFALASVPLFATPVLLWWQPRLGCVAGIVFAVLDVLFDDVQAARWAWAGHGTACLIVLVLLVQDSTRQRRIATSEGPLVLQELRRLPDGLDRLPRGRRTLLAAGLVVAGIGLLLWYSHDESTEQAHLAAAVRVDTTVTAVNNSDYTITVKAPGLSSRTIGVLENYPIGTQVPVLVDPGDAGWTRLVAEPADPTLWLTGGLCALLLAVLFFQREDAAVRWRRRAVGRDLPARKVLVDSNGLTTYLHAIGSGQPDGPFANLSTEPVPWPGRSSLGEFDRHGNPNTWLDDELDPELVAEFARAWQGESENFDPGAGITPGLALGDLSVGGWVAVLVDDAVLLPRTPLGGPRDGLGWWADRPWLPPWHRSPASGQAGQQQVTDQGPQARAALVEPLPGTPVAAAAAIPADLPWALRSDRTTMQIGWLMVTGSIVGALALKPAADWLDASWLALAGSALALGGVLMDGWTRISHRLTIEHSGARIVGTFATHWVPWEKLHGVRLVDGEILALAWDPDVIFEAGPFRRATEAAGVIAALRERAVAVGVAGREPREEFRWESLAVLLCFALAFGAGWGLVTLTL